MPGFSNPSQSPFSKGKGWERRRVDSSLRWNDKCLNEQENPSCISLKPKGEADENERG